MLEITQLLQFQIITTIKAIKQLFIYHKFIKSYIIPAMKNQFFIICFTALLLVSLSQTSESTCNDAIYKAYLEEWSKPIPSDPILYNQKFQKFCSQVKFVYESNLVNDYQLGINQFSDLLQAELAQRLNAKVLPTGQGIRVGSLQKTQKGDQIRVGAVNTTVITDWQAKGKVSAIKNQGSCGSCWAFTTAGLYQSYMMAKGQIEYDLAEQFILECTNVLVNTSNYMSSCAGGYADFSMKLVQNFGIPKQTTYPYLGSTFGSIASTPTTPNICSTNQTFIKYDNLPGVKNATNLTRYDNVTVDDIQNLLVDGPLGAMIYANAGFSSYKSGVYTGCTDFATSYAGINHAVVIVGMDANKNYIIKNSWGTAWGMNGFATVSSNFDCALSAYVYQLTWGYQLIGSSLFFLLAFILALL